MDKRPTDPQTQITDAVDVIRQHWGARPRAGIILGTGLGSFSEHIETEAIIDYLAIPHFPRSTALSHAGRLVCGRVADVRIVTMEGRYHLYEGYSLQQITLPVRVMKALGIEVLIISNASGGINPAYRTGDIVVIDDHINLMCDNPLFGKNDDRLGPRFPDMSCPYDPQLAQRALGLARQADFVAHQGIYVGLTGPNYETRAEYRMLRRSGADVVGMSTVPEVIVAVHSGLRVLALSAVTNVCSPEQLTPTSGEEVVKAARSTEPKMRDIVIGVLEDLSNGKVS